MQITFLQTLVFILEENFARQMVLINLPDYIFIDVLCTLMRQEAACKIRKIFPNNNVKLSLKLINNALKMK